MDKVDSFTQRLLDSLSTSGGEILAGLTHVIFALLVLLIGWIVTKIVVYLLRRVLKLVPLAKLTKKVNDLKLFGKTDIKFKATDAIVIFVRWFLFLVFLIIAADIMEWDFVSKEIGNLLHYLPQLFSAIVLFMIGIYIASFVRKAIKGLYDSFDLNGSRIISSLVFYIIAIIITITALTQAGIDTTVITNNITIILGAFLLTLAIAFGLGARVIVTDILRSFYARKSYEIGDRIRINGIEGTLNGIDNICMTITTDVGKMNIPIKDVVESKVEILKK